MPKFYQLSHPLTKDDDTNRVGLDGLKPKKVEEILEIECYSINSSSEPVAILGKLLSLNKFKNAMLLQT